MNQHYHFIGIGGIGMGGLALLMLAKGYKVSGSDLKDGQLIQELKKQGATVYLGHKANQIDGADVIVYSSAIDSSNPEFSAAKEKNIQILKRAQLLAQLMEGFSAITVAGAHGKTTTTSMVSNILVKAGLEPTSAVGGIVHSTSTNAWLGKGKYFVAEVDESDGSFLYFSPKYAVITNIDLEHLDYYQNLENILKAYQSFISQVSDDGLIYAYGEDERLMTLLKSSRKNFKTYGFSSHHDLYAQNIKFDQFVTTFDCFSGGRKLGEFKLNVPGHHNILNALGAIGIAFSLGIDFKVIQDSLEEFRSVKRRFQLMGKVNNILVVDDYAHHPTEIKATLEASQSIQKKRLIVVFQPHRYSRLKYLLDDFAKSLSIGDYTIITDVYAASEIPIEGVSGENLAQRIQQLTDKPVIYLKKDKIIEYLLNLVRRDDLVMTMGAGDITKLSEDLVLQLKKFQETNAVFMPSTKRMPAGKP
jgi:UDP-N-acetylmuramate--alanine ligase